MKKLNEIEKIIFPKYEKVDMKEVAKDLIIQKFGKNKLISFKYVPMHYHRQLVARAVVDDRLLVLIDEYGTSGCPTGTYFSNVAKDENTFNKQYGISIPDDVLMKACQNLFKNKEIHIEFDFETMTSPDSWVTYLEELLEDIENDEEWAEDSKKVIHAIEDIAKGKAQGYIKFIEGELI